MTNLKNKIDFAVVFSAENANPNGDPLNGNRPRTTSDGFGEVSDVALKRKIRNRKMSKKQRILFFTKSVNTGWMFGLSDRSLRSRKLKMSTRFLLVYEVRCRSNRLSLLCL